MTRGVKVNLQSPPTYDELLHEVVALKQQVVTLEEYVTKGVAFRDELQSALRRIAGELGEFADADGETMVEKVRFLTKDRDEARAALCRAREALKFYSCEANYEPNGTSITFRLGASSPIVVDSGYRAKDALSSSSPCPHEAEAKLFKERYELEQIRYEGISSANEELRGEVKRMREAIEWALGFTTDEQGCRLYRILSREERTELRRRAGGG